MKKLIINADDFGLHSEINEAILTGHTLGCITSTSLMSMGAAFTEAVQLSLAAPSLDVGVHLTLVAEKPVLSADKVKSLVDENGAFLQDYTKFIGRYWRNEIDLNEIHAEFSAQIKRVADTGIAITHLDSHQHLHVLPKITDICLDLAKQFNISAMRIPAEPYLFTGGYPASIARIIGKCGLTFLAEMARSKAKKQFIHVPEHFFGMLAGGHMQEVYLRNIIAALPDQTSEVMIHPGRNTQVLASVFPWKYQWNNELDAVISPSIMDLIREKSIKLSSFGEL